MQLVRGVCCLSFSLLCLSRAAGAQSPVVDVSASHAMYRILVSMKDGAPRADVSRALDSVLATRPFRTMFRHYNRSWRPNHLPPDVFKRMILSLRYPETYAVGENQRADQMLPRWRESYENLARYAGDLRQLDRTDLKALGHRPHHEDGVAERVDHVERARAPFFVLWRTPDRDPFAPLVVVRIGAFDLQRHACVAAMSRHRAVDGERDTAALQPEEAILAVFGGFKRNAEAKSAHVELFGEHEIVARKDGHGSFHMRS